MMTSAAEQYRKELKKHLSLDVCSGKLRTALLSRFDAMLGAMKEDYPEPAMAQLETAFGTPLRWPRTCWRTRRMRSGSAGSVLSAPYGRCSLPLRSWVWPLAWPMRGISSLFPFMHKTLSLFGSKEGIVPPQK